MVVQVKDHKKRLPEPGNELPSHQEPEVVVVLESSLSV
jgi:hypothetical protein